MWPDDQPDNTYWIGATPFASPQHSDGLLVLGRDCKSLRDLETAAAEIRLELDRVMSEARRRLEPATTDAQAFGSRPQR
jgi:hypothetical protein